MGNRAFVIFENADSTQFSPAVYLHWNGGPESIYGLLDELERWKVRADQDYECARFIQITGNFFDVGEYSLGVQGAPSSVAEVQEFASVGDNGVYLVSRANGKPYRMRRFVELHECNSRAASFRELSAAEVARESKAAYAHKYHENNDLANQLRELAEAIQKCHVAQANESA